MAIDAKLPADTPKRSTLYNKECVLRFVLAHLSVIEA